MVYEILELVVDILPPGHLVSMEFSSFLQKTGPYNPPLSSPPQKMYKMGPTAKIKECRKSCLTEQLIEFRESYHFVHG